MGKHASTTIDSASEDDHPFGAFNMNELRHPAKPFCQNELDLDGTMISNEDTEEVAYRTIKKVFTEFIFFCFTSRHADVLLFATEPFSLRSP